MSFCLGYYATDFLGCTKDGKFRATKKDDYMDFTFKMSEIKFEEGKNGEQLLAPSTIYELAARLGGLKKSRDGSCYPFSFDGRSRYNGIPVEFDEVRIRHGLSMMEALYYWISFDFDPAQYEGATIDWDEDENEIYVCVFLESAGDVLVHFDGPEWWLEAFKPAWKYDDLEYDGDSFCYYCPDDDY